MSSSGELAGSKRKTPESRKPSEQVDKVYKPSSEEQEQDQVYQPQQNTTVPVSVATASESSGKFQKLNVLLDQTTLYSKFLGNKLPANSNAKETTATNLSKLLNGTLRDYQLDGVNWLISLFENGLNGKHKY